MAFKHNAIGALVSSQPALAAHKLSKLFAKHGTRAKVAAFLEVNETTLARWLRKLAEHGVSVVRPARTRKPKAKDQTIKLSA